MRALILNVGDEVLSGKVVNTNASFLSREFGKLGIDVAKVVCVGDDLASLEKEINDFKNSDIDLLVTTGGLGPTHDDFTKEVLYSNLGIDLVLREEALNLLDSYFKKDYAKCNEKQAYFPKDAYLLKNDKGTAMGAVSEVGSKTYVILVGPPFEMEPMVKNYLIPYLLRKELEPKLIKEYIVMGIGESRVEEILEDYYIKHSLVSTCPYALNGKIRYQLSSSRNNKQEFENACKEFSSLVNDYIISDNNEDIEYKVYEELMRLGYHISFSESCTGGMLASKIINVSGASSVLNLSLVTYSNQSKIDLIGVNQETIDKFDVVSCEVATEMARGIQKFAKAEVGCGVTGYAGPGGKDDKEVGTVCFAIAIKDKVVTKKHFFLTERNILREKVTMLIYYHLYKELREIK